jgi:aminocarboxymuconate-semialdehyde decarboxylase
MYADCIAHHPSALRLAQDIFGPDHVLFGSDWPFPMGLPEGAP